MSDAVYKLVDKFMLAIQTEVQKISPEHVQEVLVQASTERRLQTKISTLQKQAKDDSSITAARTNEEQAAQRARLKVGEHMMTSLESAEQYQRTLFGVVIKSGECVSVAILPFCAGSLLLAKPLAFQVSLRALCRARPHPPKHRRTPPPPPISNINLYILI